MQVTGRLHVRADERVDFQAVWTHAFMAWCIPRVPPCRLMRKQRSGHIFQVSSVGGRSGFRQYAVSRGQVGRCGFSDSLAMEVARSGSNLHARTGRHSDQLGTAPGENMPDLLPDYEASVVRCTRCCEESKGAREGDPRKIAT